MSLPWGLLLGGIGAVGTGTASRTGVVGVVVPGCELGAEGWLAGEGDCAAHAHGGAVGAGWGCHGSGVDGKRSGL
jgi:hypothetical protein